MVVNIKNETVNIDESVEDTNGVATTENNTTIF
jgi:hypothetical protein